MTERTGDRSLFFMEIPPHQSASLPASPPKGGSLLGAPREVTKTDRRGGYHPPAGQRNGKMRSSPTGGVSVGTDRIRPPNFARVKDNPSVDLSVDTLPYTGRARNKSTARRGRRPRRPVKRLAVLKTTLPSTYRSTPSLTQGGQEISQRLVGGVVLDAPSRDLRF